MALRFSIRPGSVALAVVQELGQMLSAVKHSGADAKESNAPGFTGSKKGDASDA